jgi:uncharacterized protein YjbJ (UPF0337 family)
MIGARTFGWSHPVYTMNNHTVAGQWHAVKGKLKQKYAQLTDDDLNLVEGREEEFIGQPQARTGATREAIERYLREECHCW